MLDVFTTGVVLDCRDSLSTAIASVTELSPGYKKQMCYSNTL